MSRWSSACAAAFVCASCASATFAQSGYAVTDLGVFPTGTNSRAFGINTFGDVAGESDKDGAFYTRAVLWIDGVMFDLTGLGISGAAANAVNNAGQVVGYSDAIGLNAFLWSDDSLTELPVPLSCCSQARDINANGQIVGEASIVTIGSHHAVLWEAGKMTDLGTLGGSSSQAYAINDVGQIAGVATTSAGRSRAFLWESDEMIDLGTLGGDRSEARDINQLGHVVGYADNAADATHAFMWRGNAMTDLGTLPGGTYSYAYGLNDHDQVVGASYGDGFTGLHAVTWIDDQLVDLNNLVSAGSGWTLTRATDVNNAGQIVGQGVKGDQIRAFRLTPVAAIPTLCEWGIATMTLLLLTAATLAFSRPRTAKWSPGA